MKIWTSLAALFLAPVALAVEPVKSDPPPEAEVEAPPSIPGERIPQMCLLEGCNGVEVMNEAPIPVDIRTPRRTAFNFGRSWNVEGPGPYCVEILLPAHPVHIEFVSARLVADGLEAGGALFLDFDAFDHFIPLAVTGPRSRVVGTPVSIRTGTRSLIACLIDLGGVERIYASIAVSGYYDLPAE